MDIFSEQVLAYLWIFFKGEGITYTDELTQKLILLLLFAILFFLIPIVIAFFRKHKNIAAISVVCAVPFIACLLTLFGVMGISSKESATGYAFLVWAIALIWSVAKPLTIEIKSNECKNIKVNTENNIKVNTENKETEE